MVPFPFLLRRIQAAISESGFMVVGTSGIVEICFFILLKNKTVVTCFFHLETYLKSGYNPLK